jgi:hypothetical protein
MPQAHDIILDGDFPGHPFRGNQHVTQGEHGGVAVRSSMRAKHAELKGDKQAQKKAHKSAYHAHAAAAEDAKSKKSRKYHKTMAKFHGSRVGLTLDAVDEVDEVLDSVSYSVNVVFSEDIPVNMRQFGEKQVCFVDLGMYGGFSLVVATPEDHAEFGGGTFRIGKGERKNESIVRIDPKGMRLYFIDHEHYADTMEVKWQSPAKIKRLVIQNKAKFEAAFSRPVLDAVETSLSIVGRIYVDGELKGRALIGGDGKAMVYKGEQGTERVSFTSPVDGEIRTAMWSDDDAPLMVGWLLNPPAPAAATSPFDAFMDSGKEEWQVTQAEWVAVMTAEFHHLGTPANASDVSDFKDRHKSAVKTALDAGKPVPAEVLADYPGMKAESAEEKDARVAEADLRLKAALGIKAPKRVTMKEARDAYSMLEYSVDDLSGHQNAEFLRADVLGRLEPKMLLIKALVERGWPEQVYSPEGLLKKAQGLIDRHQAMSASGLTEDMGQSEAWGYLTHDKKLPAERVDQILATPSRVEKSGGQMNADVPKYTMAYLNAEADKQESTTVEEQAPVAQVTETRADVNAENYAWAEKSVGYEPNRPADRPFKLHSKKEPYGIGAPFGAKEGVNAMNQYFGSEESAKSWGEKNGYVVGSYPYDKKVKQVSEPMQEQAPSVDPTKSTDTAYIQTIIDGTADLLDPGLYDKLEPLFAKYEADPEMMVMLTKAADAYGKAVEAAAMGALGR